MWCMFRYISVKRCMAIFTVLGGNLSENTFGQDIDCHNYHLRRNVCLYLHSAIWEVMHRPFVGPLPEEFLGEVQPNMLPTVTIVIIIVTIKVTIIVTIMVAIIVTTITICGPLPEAHLGQLQPNMLQAISFQMRISKALKQTQANILQICLRKATQLTKQLLFLMTTFSNINSNGSNINLQSSLCL